MNANDAVKYVQERPDLMAIADLIPEGARVLDLGCGNGLFLEISRRNQTYTGSWNRYLPGGNYPVYRYRSTRDPRRFE